MSHGLFSWVEAYSGVPKSDYVREYHGCTLLRDIGDDERTRRGCEIETICIRSDGVIHGFDDKNAHLFETSIKATLVDPPPQK